MSPHGALVTPLERLLRRRIANDGPMGIDAYMADCLLHPEHGYYTTRPVFGTTGDFITAPEISQMFGEILGLWLAQCWLDQGRPARFALAELGPGRGTLMADMMRATRSVPGFAAAAEIHLIEASPRLREAQAAGLRAHAPIWHDSAGTLPDLPLFVVANEFFDALPIRQFQRSGTAWRERQIHLAQDRLALGLGPQSDPPFLRHRKADTQDGVVVEHRIAAGPVISDLAARIGRNGGAALVVDYGDWRSRGDTFQALRAHAPEDPLARPGVADLTAHVDFEALSLGADPVATGTQVSAMVSQGVFLERLGITERARTLAATLTGAALERHVAAHRRLTHPDEMGSLFKCVALAPTLAPMPPGLMP